MKKFFVLGVLVMTFLFPSCENLILGPEDSTSPEPEKYPSRFATILDSLRYALDLPALAGAIVSDTGIIEAQAVGSRRY